MWFRGHMPWTRPRDSVSKASSHTQHSALSIQHSGAARRARDGQAIIFIMVIIVFLALVAMWNMDLHKILYVKYVSQNAGDSAALMGARWQGITLNLVGDLNIMQAIALAEGDPDACGAISNAQARLCYVGPLVGFAAAQQAAKNNKIDANEDFTDILTRHADQVRTDYRTRTGPTAEMLFPEPYPGCWLEYAAMLDVIIANKVAVGADNVNYYGDYTGSHYLLETAFYDAIAGRTWCWFYNHAYDLLEDYYNWRYWEDRDPLPEIEHRLYMNSEIFGLGLVKRTTTLDSMVNSDDLAARAMARGLDDTRATNAMDLTATWYCYGERWHPWDAMDVTGEWPMPLTGTVRPQYDYMGADAVTRIEAPVGRLTPGPGGDFVTNIITWTAAAKPFGCLDETTTPNRYELVLPAFTEIRLIPLDGSSSTGGGGYNLAWRRHIDEHLRPYVDSGRTHAGCWYCQQLDVWEVKTFRDSGIAWLEVNSWRCIATPSGPGGHHSGGTRRGH